MKILLTGATGYVGKLIRSGFDKWNIQGVSSRGDSEAGIWACDLSDAVQVARLASQIQPNVIIHAAGDKNLARCEANPEQAYAANVTTTINLVRLFPKVRQLYISSDYVFSGERGGYREDDALGPVTVYGRTKACAELAGLTLSNHFYVVRLSALYDQNGTYLRFLREALSKGQEINCFEDAFYSPTYYADFLNILKHLVESASLTNRRIYHACGQRTSRFFFAKLFARAANFDPLLIKQSSRIDEKPPFIYADLSLENTMTCESLDVSVGRHQEYLNFLELTR